MLLQARINGEPLHITQAGLTFEERGVHYGDGVFETLLLQQGKVRFLTDHLARLHTGCSRLGIASIDEVTVQTEITALTHGYTHGIVKLLVTRGVGGRGYRALNTSTPTCMLGLYASLPSTQAGINVRWCTTRLARQPLLAGIKHLNRLEQVLAQMEWSDEAIAEGLMLDTEGELIAGTRSNIFLVINDVLVTPDIRYCGVQGVMRKNIIATALAMGIKVETRPVWPDELLQACEVFMSNAIRGLQPVQSLAQMHWTTGPITQTLMTRFATCVT